jgi:hypothetical protein
MATYPTAMGKPTKKKDTKKKGKSSSKKPSGGKFILQPSN